MDWTINDVANSSKFSYWVEIIGRHINLNYCNLVTGEVKQEVGFGSVAEAKTWADNHNKGL